MNLPHELEKLRDELALKNYPPYETQEGDVNESSRLRFKAGFAACFQALSEAAGEFDRDDIRELAGHYAASIIASDKYNLSHPEATLRLGYLDGRETQFEADRAVIALAKRNATWAIMECQSELENTIKQLEARLAESEEFLKSAVLALEKEYDKRSAAEARKLI